MNHLLFANVRQRVSTRSIIDGRFADRLRVGVERAVLHAVGLYFAVEGVVIREVRTVVPLQLARAGVTTAV